MTDKIRLFMAAAVVGILGLVPATASADTVVSPTSVAYADQAVGSSSPAATVTLTKNCNGMDLIFCTGIPFSVSYFPTITVSGPFTQTNDCPAALVATTGSPQSCSINVVFSPTTTGPATGLLQTGPNAGDPNVALSGTGVTAPVTPPPSTKKKCKKPKRKSASAAKKKCKKRK